MADQTEGVNRELSILRGYLREFQQFIHEDACENDWGCIPKCCELRQVIEASNAFPGEERPDQ